VAVARSALGLASVPADLQERVIGRWGVEGLLELVMLAGVYRMIAGIHSAQVPEATVRLHFAPGSAWRYSNTGYALLAIIAERGGAERVYFIGDAVPGGASLHSVHLDRVLLRRGGRLEALRLPRSDEGTGARRAAAVAPRASAPPARAASVQEVVQQSAAGLTEIIRPQPVFKDGRQQGYRVYPGRQRQQFAQLGLRPGDLITQINGMALDDPARGMEIFRSLADATSVTVTVDRNGEIEMLTLNTATLQESLGTTDDEIPSE
jgi:type II secretory pathway component PulC